MKKIFTLALFCGFSTLTLVAKADVHVCDDTNCYVLPRSEMIVGQCAVDDIGKECPDAGKRKHPHATGTICVNVKKTSSSAAEPSCAATECDGEYLLWLYNGKSMGVCHKKSYAETQCEKGCSNCNENQDCKPWLKPTPRTNKVDGAYDNCHCVDKVAAAPDKCIYTFKATITCLKNGVQTALPDQTFEVTKSENPDCQSQAVNDFKAWYNAQTEAVKNKFKELCPSHTVSTTIVTGGNNGGNTTVNAELQNAKTKLDSFFRDAEANRSGWKTADGKFNSTRLASDITAGVVLGTVGGVVSGVVIKKKQVEKGFDALHCTVGGQKVADWGDEFSVGLQR